MSINSPPIRTPPKTEWRSEMVVPYHWDNEVVDEIIQGQEGIDDLKISQFYGAVSNEIVRHGRGTDCVKNISRGDAQNFKKYLDDHNLGFIYLLNAPFNFNTSKETKYKVEEYLDWIVGELNPEAVTISSHDLAAFVRDRYKSLNIYISTIAGVMNREQYNAFQDINPSRIVLHHDANRDWEELNLLAKHAHSAGAEIELMLTESCIRHCANRDLHYSTLGREANGVDNNFHTTCNSKKLLYPREILKSNFIRPEDLSIYEDIGINKFKITGRSKPAKWLPEVVKAYQNREYDGNLIRLLGIDPTLDAENWVYINNKALDGFLDKYPNIDDDLYAEKWIQKLYNEGLFYLLDGTEYTKKNGFLEPSKFGSQILKVVGNETK